MFLKILNNFNSCVVRKISNISHRDKAILWHPYSQEKTADLRLPIVKGEGARLYDEDGNSYLDLISSWWVNIHGHCNPALAKAIYDQALKLEHVAFTYFTHEPAVTLCENLRDILHEKLSMFFFSDNGSTAVEVALKMSHQYWKNLGVKNKCKFLCFEGGYHGSTVGALGVGNEFFSGNFTEITSNKFSIPYPTTWDEDDQVESKEEEALKCMEDHIKTNGEYISAIIIEPLVQGASGMRMCRSGFLTKLVKIAQENHIFVIFDEVMTGFGRTGTHFAYLQTEIVPDFLCISKSITGGFLPLSLTVTSKSVYDAFLDESMDKAFNHGHSYTANPLSCAAAIESLKLLNSSNTQANIRNINKSHKKFMNQIKGIEKVSKVRLTGTIVAFDVPGEIVSENIRIQLQNEGIIVEPSGDSIYILPPYCITESELEFAYRKIVNVLRTL